MSDTSPAPRAPTKARAPVTSGDIARRSPSVQAALARSLFVIPSINGGSLLRRMLPTLRLPPQTVVILDQGSLDDTEAVCRAAGVRLVQLGRPHTYTEASNIGAQMAREAGCAYLFISNNDIAFTTDVGAELLAAMMEDPRLGIAAPSQVIVDEKLGRRLLAYRAEWHLDTMLFTHDVRALSDDVERLEADLCELTCAAIRMTAIDEIGFLDDDYGFYYEDADFCFRLRQAGYSCAYLPRSQIEHYTSSTFSAGMSDRKRAFMAKNMDLFARKHLGYAVGRLVAGSRGGMPSEGGAERYLPRYLQRFGLLDPGRPSLVVDAPGTRPLDYLLTDTMAICRAAPRLLSAYRGLLATSEWGRGRLTDAGLEDVGLAPLGVETDLFHPWVTVARPFAETTFLWHGRGDSSVGFPAVLEAWALFRADRPDSRLLAIGTNILDAVRHAPASLREWHGSVIADYPSDGVTLRELATPMPDEDWAKLYRSVDVVLWIDPLREATLATAMACGTLVIAPAGGPAGHLASAGALQLDGDSTLSLWRPDVSSLVLRLHEAYTLGDDGRYALARNALPLIRSRFTWRNTCAGLHEALTTWQQPRDVVSALRRRREAEAVEGLYDAREASIAEEPLELFSAAACTVRTTGEPELEVGPTPCAPSSGRGVGRQIARARTAFEALIAVQRTRGGRAALMLIRHTLNHRTKFLVRSLVIKMLSKRDVT